MKKTNKSAVITLIIAAVVIVALCIVSSLVTVTVPAGHTGVVVSFGHVEDNIIPEGLHFKLPWQQIIKMDNRAQKATVTSQAFSSDIQQVSIVCSVNYSIDRETSKELYRNVGQNYYDTVMQPRILDDIKAVFTKYSAENLIESRNLLPNQIEELLAPEMKNYGINIISISIEDIDFTDVFTDAVEAKQVAEQSKLQATIEQEQKTMEQKAEAERKLVAAEAEAQVAKIKADAEAYAVQVKAASESEANAKLAASLTELLVRYNETLRWNGELPQFVGGDSTLPILDLTKKANTNG